MILEKIHSTSDLRKLNEQELELLAGEIRSFLIEHVSKTGGHLAPNLGVVELTIALHLAFDVQRDRIVWDVGHQAYTHKILTGRAEQFDSLRQLNGLSGFPKTKESQTDAFNTGHSSTSISAALGFAKAAELSGGKERAVAVIGDGALTGGMAFEALNHAGSSKTPLIVILNDNGMSISKNVGAISKKLKKIRNTDQYFKFKEDVKSTLDRIPVIGPPLKKGIRKVKKNLKRVVIQNAIFEDMGFTYLGPVDGHSLPALHTVLNQAKKLNEPVMIHVNTVKGKGYKPAEKNPGVFHGISRFDPTTGQPVKGNAISWSALFGKTICQLAKQNEKVIAISAAMPLGTGLSAFSQEFPERFFDVGIAEQHAVTFAAAFAMAGFIPVFAVYSTFLQRAYDQVLHDAALQNLHVVFCIDRSGPVGADGETHQGVYDISYLSHIPGMTLLSPSCGEDLTAMLDYAVNECSGPVAIRYPRGEVQEQACLTSAERSPLQSLLIRKGSDVLLAAVGTMLGEALKAAELLEEKGILAAVLDVRCLKPLDLDTLRAEAAKARVVVSVESNVVIGGFGERLESALGREVIKFAYPDEPVVQGTIPELIKKYGLDGERIARAVEKSLRM